ncbi:MAG: 2-amino-3,7-dideoxy-D-threo-hept-6-ulosonate synthase [Candidatus Bathyarchaeia archaeon]
MVWGKEIRLARITDGGKMVCVPMDHGLSSGPIKGLEDMKLAVKRVEMGGGTAVILHKGIIKQLEKPPKLGLIMHLSGSTSLGTIPNWKVRVGSVEEALFLGADAVSVHVNIGGDYEAEMLSKLGDVADECDQWGVPLLAMMYPRGKNIQNAMDPEVVAHVTRIGGELGADIVKTTYTGDPDSFKRVVESCPSKVVIAGGPKADTAREVLEIVAGAMEAGAIGVTFGRNVFQHSNPVAMLRALSMIVKEGASVEETLGELEDV